MVFGLYGLNLIILKYFKMLLCSNDGTNIYIVLLRAFSLSKQCKKAFFFISNTSKRGKCKIEIFKRVVVGFSYSDSEKKTCSGNSMARALKGRMFK